ncbi:MAG: hypothetical protein H8D97_00595 [Proteobacteria bacterium]|nr:hypothetical protein [Pseudomonadota bacterium]
MTNILENINSLILEVLSGGIPNIKIITKTGREEKIKTMLIELYNQYPSIPKFYNNIEIKFGVTPNSFNNKITLNTRLKEPLGLLEVLVHEQLHGFVDKWVNKDADNEYKWLFPDYSDNGERSFYLHIIVCWNTRNWLLNNLTSKEVDFIYSSWQAYPKTEELVKKDFNKIKKILEQHDLVYKII